jgi:uncharacterized PurR-regulated membrane protein YhhQ (DUF165 family)
MIYGPAMITLIQRRKIEGIAFLLAFTACIPIANWLIGHVGAFCVPNGPCLIPVAPGIDAPSGVLMVGLALVLRDLMQRRLGKAWALIAILAGAVLSAAIAPPQLVMASTVSFAVSELADFAVYTPLQRRQLVLAVFLSSLAGLVADSLLFLWLAFDDFSFLGGQVIGKLWMVMLSLPLIAMLRRRDEKIGLQPV